MAKGKIPHSQYFTECLQLLAILKQNGSDDLCMVWPFGRNSHNYGAVTINGVAIGTHVAAFSATHGAVHPGHEVLHSCDNPPCFNPDHVRGGTHLDNIADAVARKRFPVGATHRNARLSAESVAEMQRLYSRSAHNRGRRPLPGEYSLSRLAEMFGVSLQYVHKVVTGQRRKHG
jgi:hypothetical protein